MLYEYSLKKIKMESEEIEVFVIEKILRASDFERRIEKLSIFNRDYLDFCHEDNDIYFYFSIDTAKQGFNDKNNVTHRLNVLASVHALLERPPSFDSSYFKQINRGQIRVE